MRRTSGAGLALLLSGCMVGPHYAPPKVDVPEHFPEPAGIHTDAPDEQLTEWWRQFGDPKLQDLIARSLVANLDLKTAASRIRQARAQEILAGSAGLPNVNANGVGVYSHSNGNPLAGLTGGGGGSQGSGGADDGSSESDSSRTTKLFAAGFDATWELDLFGRVRHGVEAARAGAEVTEWEYRAAQVSLSAEVAIDYLTLCAARAQSRIVHDSIQRQADALSILEARQRAGLIGGLEINQQRAQLANTRAQLPPLEAQVRATSHALAVLLALEPESLVDELNSADQIPSLPTAVPLGLPSDLLRRRPDVRAAERSLAAATAEVGVAVADLYPRFDLLAALNYTNDSLSGLLSSDHLSRVGAGLVRWPLLEGGRGHAAVRISEEQRQQAYLAYQKSVLTAIQDTDDSLARLQSAQGRIAALEEADAAASSSLGIARAQADHGQAPYLNVLTANSTLLDVDAQLVQSRLQLATSTIALYKALGGGWSSDQ
jgi:outer membrane protein, multidrug efflux system